MTPRRNRVLAQPQRNADQDRFGHRRGRLALRDALDQESHGVRPDVDRGEIEFLIQHVYAIREDKIAIFLRIRHGNARKVAAASAGEAARRRKAGCRPCRRPPARPRCRQSFVHDPAQLPADRFVVNRRIRLDAVIQIARHPVGRTDIDPLVAAVTEDQNARMLQVTVDDAAYFDPPAIVRGSHDRASCRAPAGAAGRQRRRRHRVDGSASRR